MSLGALVDVLEDCCVWAVEASGYTMRERETGV